MKSKPPVPATSKGDIAHSLVRAGIGSVPVIGNAAVELFQLLIAPPLEKRRQEWMEAVAGGLEKLEQQQKCVIDDLKSNDAFIDTVMQASQAALRNSQTEKREALRNAVLNSALPSAPDESRRQIFVNWVETLTVWHLKMLKLFADPPAWYHASKRPPPRFAISGSLSALLIDAYPELRDQRDLYDKLAKDLHGEGLLNTSSLHTMMSGSGPLERRATELGRQFLAFVSDPTA